MNDKPRPRTCWVLLEHLPGYASVPLLVFMDRQTARDYYESVSTAPTRGRPVTFTLEETEVRE
jgi:hypothetical protein